MLSVKRVAVDEKNTANENRLRASRRRVHTADSAFGGSGGSSGQSASVTD